MFATKRAIQHYNLENCLVFLFMFNQIIKYSFKENLSVMHRYTAIGCWCMRHEIVFHFHPICAFKFKLGEKLNLLLKENIWAILTSWIFDYKVLSGYIWIKKKKKKIIVFQEICKLQGFNRDHLKKLILGVNLILGMGYVIWLLGCRKWVLGITDLDCFSLVQWYCPSVHLSIEWHASQKY